VDEDILSHRDEKFKMGIRKIRGSSETSRWIRSRGRRYDQKCGPLGHHLRRLIRWGLVTIRKLLLTCDSCHKMFIFWSCFFILGTQHVCRKEWLRAKETD
jgi:hypothetical protein